MPSNYLVLRTPSGISGDMLLTGMAKLAGLSDSDLDLRVECLGIKALTGCIRIEKTSVNHISGWRAKVSLPREHAHRSFLEIRKIIHASGMTAGAKDFAESAFSILAQAEGEIHSVAPAEVTFHEVGALDSILDICLVASIFDEISPHRFICSPIPLCDGVIRCDHGVLAAPAPAVLHMLIDVPVYGIDSTGETVTPTAIALLKALHASFESWPSIRIKTVARVYGGKNLPNVPNGAIFVLGEPHEHDPAAELPHGTDRVNRP